uniref:Uncharacterized protein n=1 Tax=Glossina brevipalpis TaxID=37001 RepID=A0A1A9W7E6_9MUSC
MKDIISAVYSTTTTTTTTTTITTNVSSSIIRSVVNGSKSGNIIVLSSKVENSKKFNLRFRAYPMSGYLYASLASYYDVNINKKILESKNNSKIV